jgi:hypothetical protein
MNNLRDCRAQEAQCRKRALTDQEHRDLWLSMAERWSYLANKEAAFHVGKGIFLRRDDDLHDDDSTVKADA